MIIGLTGEAGAGKDTVGAILVDEHGFTRLSFADIMRDALLILDPLVADIDRVYVARLSTIVGSMDWDAAKRHPKYGREVRGLLEKFGDAAKSVSGYNVFVDTIARKIIEGRDYVITDARYPNEAELVWSRAGHLVEVVRPNNPHKIDSKHPSATNRLPVDRVIANMGSADDLKPGVEWLLDTLGRAKT